MSNENATQPSAATVPATPPGSSQPRFKRSRMKLQTASDCSAALALLLREWRSGLLDSQELSRAANALSVLSRMIETSDLEDRLERIEDAMRAAQPQRRVA